MLVSVHKPTVLVVKATYAGLKASGNKRSGYVQRDTPVIYQCSNVEFQPLKPLIQPTTICHTSKGWAICYEHLEPTNMP